MTRALKVFIWCVVFVGLVVLAVVVLRAQTTTVVRSWTSPGDRKPDGTVEAVVEIDLRYSTDSVAFWNNPLTGVRVGPSVVPPKAPGLKNSMVVSGVPDDRRIYWRVRSRDRAGNWSLWSNRFNETTPDRTPADSIADLK